MRFAFGFDVYPPTHVSVFLLRREYYLLPGTRKNPIKLLANIYDPMLLHTLTLDIIPVVLLGTPFAACGTPAAINYWVRTYKAPVEVTNGYPGIRPRQKLMPVRDATSRATFGARDGWPAHRFVAFCDIHTGGDPSSAYVQFFTLETVRDTIRPHDILVADLYCSDRLSASVVLESVSKKLSPWQRHDRGDLSSRTNMDELRVLPIAYKRHHSWLSLTNRPRTAR